MRKWQSVHNGNLFMNRNWRPSSCLCIGIAGILFFAVITSPFGAGSFLNSRSMDVFAQSTNETLEVPDDPSQPQSPMTSIASQPPLNQNFNWQGQISASPSVLPDRNETQSAVVLIPRADGAIYSGILTYQSTRPVQPVVWNVVALTNATAVLPEEFGETNGQIRSLVDLNTNRTAQVVLSAIQDAGTSGSIPFSGDAIELVGEEGSVDEPFIVTYSLTAQASTPMIVNDLESLTNFNASAVTENEDEG
ncbi:MAG: hypothetical protein WBP83_11645 [Nitrososphaeraceae archaeon]